MITKIMCIDDDQIALRICDLFLRKTLDVEEIICATSGREALTYFDQLTDQADGGSELVLAPQLVFLDLNMPEMNGFEFLDLYQDKYHRSFPNTKIVVLSSTIDPHDLKMTQKYDAVIDFIRKPLNRDEVSRLKAHNFVKSL
ncbi:MAG: response regulator transcription factor [Sphingobacteriaceae bacterium]